MVALEKSEILERIAREKIIEDYLDLSIQAQPAGIDLTLRRVYRFRGAGRIDFDNSERSLPELEELEFGEDGWIYL
ncbi:deoxyuridine 5'-triphosphate nucleotidohydrolase, partial [archaeon]|nr:deoxyuridine 5'-triphosphate nucleotidohydrolase [archaeon]